MSGFLFVSFSSSVSSSSLCSLTPDGLLRREKKRQRKRRKSQRISSQTTKSITSQPGRTFVDHCGHQGLTIWEIVILKLTTTYPTEQAMDGQEWESGVGR